MRGAVMFWGRFALALVVAALIIYGSVRSDGLQHECALGYSIIGSLAITAIILLAIVTTGLVGGWNARRNALRRSDRAGVAVFAITSSDDLQHHSLGCPGA